LFKIVISLGHKHSQNSYASSWSKDKKSTLQIFKFPPVFMQRHFKAIWPVLFV